MDQISRNLDLQVEYDVLDGHDGDQLRFINEESFYRELNLRCDMSQAKEAESYYRQTKNQIKQMDELD